jgi:hypothetical protein
MWLTYVVSNHKVLIKQKNWSMMSNKKTRFRKLVNGVKLQNLDKIHLVHGVKFQNFV